jgi:D-alanyl-lipoteichoic acid acyltransferase DltB (MBOAT superfamily)
MLFNSFEFLFVFLPIVFFLYFYLNKKRLTIASKSVLVAGSLFFYSWWNILYLPLILSSILVNYVIGSLLSSNNDNNKFSKKSFLFFGIVFNLLLLGYFKYSDFLIENINTVFNANLSLLYLTLPLAISFFTFQQIAYLVDSYRNKTKEHDFLNYIVFVTFFPQLIAGPIVHHKEMMPQFLCAKNKIINHKNIVLGIFIFSIGLFKKVVIADTFSVWASVGFDVNQQLHLFEAWFTSLSYTFQLYFDFSGYTDMAVGLALLFNIKLPLNFNSPYKSTNIQDFWRRWHITLSRFLRDYLYVPLGGSRVKDFKIYNNLMITFLVGGIWHGAGWTFIFWGFLHGIALIIHRIFTYSGIRISRFLAWFITFNFINISWVFFRAREWEDAIKVIKGMLGLSGVMLPNKFRELLQFNDVSGIKFGDIYTNFYGDSDMLVWIILGFFLVLFFNNSNQMLSQFKMSNKMLIFIAFTLSIGLMNISKTSEFLYFNF